MAEDKDQVDLIGMAYQNARTEGVQLRAGGVGYLKVVAPAKVNLYLGVGAKRADGYHPVENGRGGKPHAGLGYPSDLHGHWRY